MKRLDEANLTIEPSKCQYLQRETSFSGHIAGNGTCQGGQKEVQTEIINPQTTLPKEMVAKGDKEDKERTTQENSPENTTPRGETRGVDIESILDQPARENITSPADKRSSVGDSGAMNTTPLSMIQEVLLNKKEGKKSKFTVEFEEREEKGKSRVRIDIWEIDEKTPENDGTIG